MTCVIPKPFYKQLVNTVKKWLLLSPSAHHFDGQIGNESIAEKMSGGVSGPKYETFINLLKLNDILLPSPICVGLRAH